MNTPAFKPGGNRYLILPDQLPEETETIGGITLTKVHDPSKLAIEGTVVAKGKSCIDYELGDKVAFGKFSGYDLKLDGVDYKIFQENEIFGTVLATPFDDDSPSLPLVMGEIV
jgi:chaperonin GroES